MIGHIEVIFDEVLSRGLPRFFPQLLVDDSSLNDSQHVSMDLSSSHFDDDPPMSISRSTPSIVIGQTNIDDKYLIHDSSRACFIEVSSSLHDAPSNIPLVEQLYDDLLTCFPAPTLPSLAMS